MESHGRARVVVGYLALRRTLGPVPRESWSSQVDVVFTRVGTVTRLGLSVKAGISALLRRKQTDRSRDFRAYRRQRVAIQKHSDFGEFYLNYDNFNARLRRFLVRSFACVHGVVVLINLFSIR